MEHLQEAFLETLVAEQGASVNTVAAYKSDLSRYSAWLAKQKLDFLSAQKTDLADFMTALYAEGLAARSTARLFSAVKKFHGFLVSENLRPDNPSEDLQRPKVGRPLPKYLSEEDVTKLLQAAYDMDDKTPAAHKTKLRMVCLLEVLYATGLRVSELVSLRRQNVNPHRQSLIVKGKGGRDRMVPFNEAAQQALMHWISERDADAGDAASAFLFPSRGRAGHMTRQRFAQHLDALAQAAGLTCKITPHIVRHAFATHLLAHGADLRSVQQMLGHADISTTQVYTHILQSQQAALVSRAHPLSKQDKKSAKEPIE